MIHNPSRDRSTFLWCPQAVTGYPRCAATGGGCHSTSWAVGPDRHPGPPRACLLTGFASSAPHRRHPHGNLTLDGVLVRPSRAVLEVLAAAVTDGSLRPVVDQVLELADAALAHRRVESRRGQGKVVLRVAG